MGMFSKPKAPAPLDVGKVAGQANEQNTANAFQQAAFNRPNQTNQYGGTLSYQQTGTDAQGNPTFSQTQGLGAEGQQFAGGFSNLGQQYIQGASDFQANRPDMSSNAAFDRAVDFADPVIQKRYAQRREALDNKLKNQGFTETDEGYGAGMEDLGTEEDNARNQLISSLQGQLFNQGIADRNQQQGEFNLLTPGVQYGGNTITGGFANVPGVNVANVDVAGLYGQQNSDAWKKYQAEQQGYNSMLGGLAGIGGTILGGPIGGYLTSSMFPSGGRSGGYGYGK